MTSQQNLEKREENLELLRKGASAWNRTRSKDIKIIRTGVSLIGAELRKAELGGVDLRYARLASADFSGAVLDKALLTRASLVKANLSGAHLRGAHLAVANLIGANLSNADLTGANLGYAQLSGANLSGAILDGANLDNANLSNAKLRNAKLRGATLSNAILVNADMTKADLSDCIVFGVSVWNVKLDGARQNNLVITDDDEPTVTVDNLEVAQFIYLLLKNEKIRGVIETIGKKAVLILGRFTPQRKAVLDALRDELRTRGYLPIIFDFDRPASKNLTETVSTLAHMSLFVIADITQAKSIPQELGRIVPMLPSVPVQPILQARANEYSMFDDFYDYASVLPLYTYASQKTLIDSLKEKVITPAVNKALEIEKRRKARLTQRRR
jgi:uncharacterized protein YjbI with pentapeptide repeats